MSDDTSLDGDRESGDDVVNDDDDDADVGHFMLLPVSTSDNRGAPTECIECVISMVF